MALHDRFARAGQNAAARVDAALDFSQAVLGADPKYAKAVPGLADKLEAMRKQPRNYLAHEYLNREWNCMFFTDVVEALTPAKLDYACTATPLDFVPPIDLTPEGVAFLSTIEPEQAAAQAAERCALLNAHLCERAQFNGEIDSLASPVVGGGVAVGRVDQLFLRARHLGKESPTEWAQYAWIALSAGGERLMKDGKPIDKAEDNLRELEQRATELQDKRLPILKALMVAK